MPHYFTLAEANLALETIRPLLKDILAIRESILERHPETWSLVEKVAGNGGSPEASRLVEDFDRLDRLVHQLQATGVILKDINTGLIDFPAMRGDHEVYLCWQYGEGELAFWHEIDAGFGGRQPIETF